MTFYSGSENLEDGGDAEPDDGPTVLTFDRVPPKRTYRGRQYPGST
jgi:hypothetical protein